MSKNNILVRNTRGD